MAADVDECMLPFICQAEAGLYVLRRVAGSVSGPRDARFAARMGLRAGVILSRKMFHKITGMGRNSHLILLYQDFVMHSPIKYFESSARKLVKQSVPGVVETFQIINARDVPVGLISLGLSILLEPYCDHLKNEHGIDTAFHDCTRVLVRDGCFAGYDPCMTLCAPEHKAERLRARVEEFGARNPLAIGHDRDDACMFRAARELGGMALGVNPVPDTFPHLDAAVFAPDWHPVARFLDTAFREDGLAS